MKFNKHNKNILYLLSSNWMAVTYLCLPQSGTYVSLLIRFTEVSLLTKLSFEQQIYRTSQVCCLDLRWISSITVSSTMLSKLSSALSFRLVLITVIRFSLGAPKILSVNFIKFKIMLPDSSAVLPGLTTHRRSFVIYSGFLSNSVRKYSKSWLLKVLSEFHKRGELCSG